MKFVNDDGRETVYMASGSGGIALLAVHGINSLFAYTEHVVDPKIHIMKYPSLLKLAELTGWSLVDFWAVMNHFLVFRFLTLGLNIVLFFSQLHLHSVSMLIARFTAGCLPTVGARGSQNESLIRIVNKKIVSRASWA